MYVHPLPYFLTDDAAERRRRGNIPQCHAARPMGRVDGWMDGVTDTDAQTKKWMLQPVVMLNTLNVFVVAAFTAARAFAVFQKRCQVKQNQIYNFRLYI